MLDPNPSTWVKIPDHPTATIKFQKQRAPSDLLPPPPPASLMGLQAAAPFAPPLIPAPAMMPPNAAALGLLPAPSAPTHVWSNQAQSLASGAPETHLPTGSFKSSAAAAAPSGLMTSESQNEYSPQQAAPSAGSSEPASGFGGISLSFGNGRSISFGGGQGLTIGGRAGAISIGGKGGGAGSDNTAAASGYSESKGSSGGYGEPGARPAAGYGGGGYEHDGYVSKHPTMSVDVPRKGKTIVHANLDMAPIKFRLHSSPRVKITTGSRDPLEKPSEEEMTEMEEDIFEPPEPFPKKNTTATANETSSSSMNETSNGNSTSMTTISPMKLNDLNSNSIYNNGHNARPYNNGR